VTYTKAALTGPVNPLEGADLDGSATEFERDKKKQAAVVTAARFLYMVVLYMTPVEQKKYPPACEYLNGIVKQGV
jgi:hypothetical protein